MNQAQVIVLQSQLIAALRKENQLQWAVMKLDLRIAHFEARAVVTAHEAYHHKGQLNNNEALLNWLRNEKGKEETRLAKLTELIDELVSQLERALQSLSADDLTWMLPDQFRVSEPEIHNNPTKPVPSALLTGVGGPQRDTVGNTPEFVAGTRESGTDIDGIDFRHTGPGSSSMHMKAPGQGNTINDPAPAGSADWQHEGYIPE